MGPYATEAAAVTAPMPQAVRNLHRQSGHHNIGRDVRDLQLSFLREACSDARVELGAYDLRILTWLASYEAASVQALIGIISRAHATEAERLRTALAEILRMTSPEALAHSDNGDRVLARIRTAVGNVLSGQGGEGR